MATKRTVAGLVKRADDSPWANATLVFQLTPGTYDGTAQRPVNTVTIKTTIDGTFSVDLWVNNGEIPSHYICRLPDGDSFNFTVPDGVGTIELSYLRSLGDQSPTSPTYQVVQLYIQDYVADAISVHNADPTAHGGFSSGGAYHLEFTPDMLTSGKLTVNHNKNGYPSSVSLYNTSLSSIDIPSGIVRLVSANSLEIDLASLAVTAGHVVVGACAGIFLLPSLRGVIVSQSSLSGSLSVAKPLQGQVLGASSASGRLSVGKPLRGQISSTSGASGLLRVAKQLQGVIGGVGSLQGSLTVTRANSLTGAISGIGSLSGSLSVGKPLQGVVVGVGSLAGSLSTGKPLQGSIGGTGSLSGNLSVGKPLQGVVTGVGSLSGSLSVRKPLQGAVVGIGSLSGSLSTGKPLQGSIAGISALSGSLSVGKPLRGQIVSVGSLSGSLTVGNSPPSLDFSKPSNSMYVSEG